MNNKKDYQTSEYRGYKVTSYLAKTNYGHRRISRIVRPDGTSVDLMAWGFKHRNGRNNNVAFTHSRCIKYAALKIDYELDGADSALGKIEAWQKEHPHSLY